MSSLSLAFIHEIRQKNGTRRSSHWFDLDKMETGKEKCIRNISENTVCVGLATSAIYIHTSFLCMWRARADVLVVRKCRCESYTCVVHTAHLVAPFSCRFVCLAFANARSILCHSVLRSLCLAKAQKRDRRKHTHTSCPHVSIATAIKSCRIGHRWLVNLDLVFI